MNELCLFEQIILCMIDDHLEICFILLADGNCADHVNVLPVLLCVLVHVKSEHDASRGSFFF
jgi:hypothetical protein